MADYRTDLDTNLPVERYWWKTKDANLSSNIFSLVNYLDKQQSQVHLNNLRHYRLYSNTNMLGMGNMSFSKNTPGVQNRVRLNVVKSIIDTLVGKIGKSVAKPSFVTSGGDYSQQQRAKKLTKFVSGIFYGNEFAQKVAPAVLLDALIFGTGAAKIYEENREIKIERVLTDEVIIDLAESCYGTPRQIFQKKYMHREVLSDMFPESRRDIANAQSSDADERDLAYFSARQRSIGDQVKVYEAWHLPSGKDAKDGKHAIVVSNKTLFVEPWEFDQFPFAFVRWSKPVIGFWGVGLPEELEGIQVEINKLLKTIQLIMHLFVPKVIMDSSSKIVKSHINNEIGSILEYAGVKPDLWVPNAVPQQMFEHLDRLYARAYEIAGMSQLSAQSTKPAGLNSGAALREYHDIETERFIMAGKEFENFVMDTAKFSVSLARTMYERDDDSVDLEVKTPDRKFIDSIKWSEVDLKDDEFITQVFPTSMLPSTPEGRFQKVVEMIQAGMIPPDEGMKLLDFPDLESFQGLQLAAVEDMDMVIEQIIDRGVYVGPEPYQNLQMGIQKMQSAYLRAKMNSVSEERLELIRRWIAEADAMMQQALAASLPAPTPGMLAPGPEAPANPQATPVSELLPNVNEPTIQ